MARENASAAPQLIHGASVTVDELRAALGLPSVTPVLDRHKVTVGTDWAGRPAVAVEVAAEVVTAERAARDSHDARWAAYERYRDDLARREQEGVSHTYREAFEREQRRGLGDGVAAQRAAEAARAWREAHTAEPVGFERWRG